MIERLKRPKSDLKWAREQFGQIKSVNELDPESILLVAGAAGTRGARHEDTGWLRAYLKAADFSALKYIGHGPELVAATAMAEVFERLEYDTILDNPIYLDAARGYLQNFSRIATAHEANEHGARIANWRWKIDYALHRPARVDKMVEVLYDHPDVLKRRLDRLPNLDWRDRRQEASDPVAVWAAAVNVYHDVRTGESAQEYLQERARQIPSEAAAFIRNAPAWIEGFGWSDAAAKLYAEEGSAAGLKIGLKIPAREMQYGLKRIEVAQRKHNSRPTVRARNLAQRALGRVWQK